MNQSAGGGGEGGAPPPLTTAQGRSSARDEDVDEKPHQKRDEMILHELAQNMRNLDPGASDSGTKVEGRTGGGHAPLGDFVPHHPNLSQGTNPFARCCIKIQNTF